MSLADRAVGGSGAVPAADDSRSPLVASACLIAVLAWALVDRGNFRPGRPW